MCGAEFEVAPILYLSGQKFQVEPFCLGSPLQVAAFIPLRALFYTELRDVLILDGVFEFDGLGPGA